MTWRVASAALLFSLAIACSTATAIPSGAQTVRASATEDALLLEPSVVGSGDVYLVLDESAYAASFVHRSADASDPQSPPLPVTDDDIRSLERDGSFQGATHQGLSLPPYGSVSRIGPLIEGKYVFMIDDDGDGRSRIAVLEVRD